MKTVIVALLVAMLFALVSPVRAQEATPVGTPLGTPDAIALVPHTSEAFGYQTVVPEGWTDAGRGLFLRQRTPDDLAVLAQQSAPLAPAAVLDELVPQLALTEAPEPVGTHQGTVLEWTLYRVDVAAAGIEVAVDLALANVDGTTYLVLLQTPPDEYAALHEQVFLPALDAFAPLVAEATPVAYRVEDVSFDNGEVTLAGTLTLPEGDGPFPAIVLVSGSGPQDRDESLAGIPIKPFALLADGLTNAGVAVLRYDDRGVGRSTGDFSTASISDFASDAEAAIAYLLTRDEIDPDQVGLLGHSEGGLVAAMLGARNADLDFLIALAGPGVNGREVLILQNELILAADGAAPEEIEAQLAFLDELLPVLEDPETDPAAIEELVYERSLAAAQALPDDERAALGDLEEYARMVARQSSQGSAAWYQEFLSYDPAADWARTTVPVLAIFGGKDVQVDAEQNAPALEAALAEGGNDDVTVMTLPDANHLFQVAETGSPSEYETLGAEFTPELMSTLLDWLRDHIEIRE